MQRYFALNLAWQAFGNKHWQPAWRAADPKPSYVIGEETPKLFFSVQLQHVSRSRAGSERDFLLTSKCEGCSDSGALLGGGD
jgi:hypothetical protein